MGEERNDEPERRSTDLVANTTLCIRNEQGQCGAASCGSAHEEEVSASALAAAAAATAAPSVGSIGHPWSCKAPCKYFWKARGCKDGVKCNRCHLCPWSKHGSIGAGARAGDGSGDIGCQQDSGGGSEGGGPGGRCRQHSSSEGVAGSGGKRKRAAGKGDVDAQSYAPAQKRRQKVVEDALLCAAPPQLNEQGNSLPSWLRTTARDAGLSSSACGSYPPPRLASISAPPPCGGPPFYAAAAAAAGAAAAAAAAAPPAWSYPSRPAYPLHPHAVSAPPSHHHHYGIPQQQPRPHARLEHPHHQQHYHHQNGYMAVSSTGHSSYARGHAYVYSHACVYDYTAPRLAAASATLPPGHMGFPGPRPPPHMP